MTTTSPAVIAPSASASSALRSPSKTRAVPVKVESSKPALLTTAPSGASDALEDREAAGGVDRPVELAQDLAVERLGVEVGEVLGHRLAGAGQHVAVQVAGVEQRAQQHRDAADAVEVGP